MYFLKDFIYLFLERVEGREKERERNINVWLPLVHPQRGWEDLARNPGMCPDWESNRWPFGSQASAQSTELHQPGLYFCFNIFFEHSTVLQGKISTFWLASDQSTCLDVENFNTFW